jgi:DSF synthase
MGGDLELFARSVFNKDVETLRDYAIKCIQVVYNFNNSFEADVVVISVVQGNAFGGGFECALACDYIIAEEQAVFSFPEVIFGTFPGMGAYSFLTRKAGYHMAAAMINSNQKWTATKLNCNGIINFITTTGNGVHCLYELLAADKFSKIGKHQKMCTAVPFLELKNIVELWVESLMALNEKQISIVKKIVFAQKKVASDAKPN